MPPFSEINFNRTPVTLIISAVAVALEVVFTLDEPRRLPYYNDVLGILPSIWQGQVWRPFTTALLHGGLLHAAFNVYWIVRFGSALEHRFGSFRYLGLVVLLGYTSMLLQFLVTSFDGGPLAMIVGLSGILYGLLGILIIGRRRFRDLDEVCDAQTVQFLLFWLVLCIFLTYGNVLPVANTAHAAGLGFGLLYGLAAFDTRYRRRWQVAAGLATFLVLATLVACPGHPYYEMVKGRQVQIEMLFEQPQPPGN